MEKDGVKPKKAKTTTKGGGGRRWQEGVEQEPQWVTEMRQRFEARGIKL